MIHSLSLALFPLAGLLAAQSVDSRANASVAGLVTGISMGGEAKREALPGVWVTLNRLPLRGESGFTSVLRRVQTARDGGYSFTGLPLGRYEVCPQIPDSLYLNPCQWPELLPEGSTPGVGPNVTLTNLAANARLDVTLQQGVILNLRLEDPARRLDTAAVSRGDRAPYVGIVLASGRRSPAAPIYGRNGLYVYSVLVPAGQAVRPVIESTAVELEDAARQRLPTGLGARLTLAPGQPPAEVVFRVAGGKL